MKDIVRHFIVFLCLLDGVTVAFAADVTILTTFSGDTGPGPKDAPDNVGAVGPDHVVSFTNANVVIHDKKTGKVVKRMTQTEFWRDVVKPGFNQPRWNDPRLFYNPLIGRWIATHATGVGFLAVSESSDPTKGWNGVQIPMEKTDPSIRLGVDRNGLYIAYSVLKRDIHSMTDVYAIPVADVVASDGPTFAHVQTFPKLEIDAFPATDLDPDKPADAPEMILNREFGDNFNKLYMYRITWSGNTASISEKQTIPLGKTYVSPNGRSLKNLGSQPAPGGKIRADEARRTMCVYQHAGSLFTCNGAKRTLDSRPGVFWCEVRAADGAVLQQGLVDDPAYDLLIPSLAVDRGGNVGIGCTRSSEKEFASVVVMMRAAGDPRNTMRPPVLAAKGTAVLSSSRNGKFGIGWGNYNSTCLDPSDPTVIWTHQEYATDPAVDHYTTCWVAFKLK